MNRSTIVAAFTATLALSSTAFADGDEVRFRGAFTLTSVKNCMARYVGETFNSAFRPASVGANPNITSLSQLNQYSGDVYELAGANLTTRRWLPVDGNGIDNLHYSFKARIYMTQLSPKVIDSKTLQIDVAGYIENMGNDPGVDGKLCLAGFRGAYFRRVE